MLDLNLIRKDPDYVKAGLAKRGYEADFTELLKWDEERRAILAENESIKAERNKLNKQMPALRKQGQDVAPLLEQLKGRDLTVEDKKPEPPKHAKPYDWQADSAPSLVVDASSKHTQDIAYEISENLEKLVGSEPEPDVKVAPAKPAQTRMDSATIKFDNLKFGKNYDPTKES